MRRIVFSMFVAALAAVLIPTTALAKGASEATIVGPGLSGPIELRAFGGSETSGQLADIAQSAGFFPQVFGQTPDPIALDRPDGPLGPRYTITYVMPGPNNQRSELVQDVYPYAEPAPVTYMQPGQRFWTTERTHGGWYVATWEPLKGQLVAAGLPTTAPAVGGGDDDGFPWVVTGGLAVLAALFGAIVLAALRMRRRPHTAAA
jgi:hypothetical protein